MSTFNDNLNTNREKIETTLRHLVPNEQGHSSGLYEAARYSLLNGGKRLRPLLALATCSALGGEEEHILWPACAIELVHTYSMIHDDLPCMDNDDFRRGKPTLHKAFSESHALLAGDFLLTHAFEILSNSPHLSSQQIVELVQILSNSAGGQGMVKGQFIDVQVSPEYINSDDLNVLQQCKTGRLIEAAVDLGAVVAGAKKQEREGLKAFSRSLGRAYQIIDDTLDVTASEAKHGRAIASDVMNGKKTYVTLYGLEKAKELAEANLSHALKSLRSLCLETSFLEWLAERFVRRDV